VHVARSDPAPTAPPGKADRVVLVMAVETTTKQ
jgi:hypothetical protein